MFIIELYIFLFISEEHLSLTVNMLNQFITVYRPFINIAIYLLSFKFSLINCSTSAF